MSVQQVPGKIPDPATLTRQIPRSWAMVPQSGSAQDPYGARAFPGWLTQYQVAKDSRGDSRRPHRCDRARYRLQWRFTLSRWSRGGAAHWLGIDVDEPRSQSGRVLLQTLNLDIEFRKFSVYEVDSIPGKFDQVVFYGASLPGAISSVGAGQS